MSEFVLAEAGVSDNEKFSGDEKEDDQDFIEYEDLIDNSNEEEDVTFHRRVNEKIRKMED